ARRGCCSGVAGICVAVSGVVRARTTGGQDCERQNRYHCQEFFDHCFRLLLIIRAFAATIMPLASMVFGLNSQVRCATLEHRAKAEYEIGTLPGKSAKGSLPLNLSNSLKRSYVN